MTSRRNIERHIESKALGRGEYCRMHQSLQGATFHREHAIPLSRGGPTQPDNLAWACPSCNLHKANRFDVIAPDTGNRVPLFNPRSGDWDEHFVGMVTAPSVKHRSAGPPLPHLSSITLDAYRFAKPRSFSASSRRTRAADNHRQCSPGSTLKEPTFPRSPQPPSARMARG